jgi:hypothetical protein
MKKIFIAFALLLFACTIKAQTQKDFHPLYIDSLIITQDKIKLVARNVKATVKQTKSSTQLTIEGIYTDSAKTIIDTSIIKHE